MTARAAHVLVIWTFFIRLPAEVMMTMGILLSDKLCALTIRFEVFSFFFFFFFTAFKLREANSQLSNGSNLDKQDTEGKQGYKQPWRLERIHQTANIWTKTIIAVHWSAWLLEASDSCPKKRLITYELRRCCCSVTTGAIHRSRGFLRFEDIRGWCPK